MREKTIENTKMGYSAVYPMGAERIAFRLRERGYMIYLLKILNFGK